MIPEAEIHRNRVDDIIVFRSLKPADLAEIVNIQLKRVEERLLREKGITVRVTEKAMKLLAERGYDPLFGARPLKRVIQTEILNPLAKQIISGTVREKSTVLVDTKKKDFILSVQ